MFALAYAPGPCAVAKEKGNRDKKVNKPGKVLAVLICPVSIFPCTSPRSIFRYLEGKTEETVSMWYVKALAPTYIEDVLDLYFTVCSSIPSYTAEGNKM